MVYRRGPIARTLNAEPILDYAGGVFDDPLESWELHHIVSPTGRGYDAATGVLTCECVIRV